jgi:protein required for attachment to host cells
MSYRQEARRPSNVWVVVADRAAGRVFSAEWPDLSGFREVEGLVHPEGSLHGRDLHPDRFGRNHAPDGHGFTDAPQTDLKHYTAGTFAHQIATHLDNERTRDAFGRLVVIAPPLLLGELRERYTPSLRKLVVAEVDKELAGSTPEEILQHARQAVATAQAPAT